MSKHSKNRIPRITDEQIRAAFPERSVAEKKLYPRERYLQETEAAKILVKVAEKGRLADFPEDVKLFDLGKALHLLCSHSPEKGDRMLQLLAGWREAEEEMFIEAIKLMY